MSDMNINAVLSQIRTLSSQIQSASHNGTSAAPNVAGNSAKTEAASSFAKLMSNGIAQVNQTQLRADQLATAFERGTPGVELPEVMLEMQKANVSFRALTEVRNRFVSVYQEIMNMPI